MFDIDGGFKTLILWWESFSKFKTARVILYMKVQGNEKKRLGSWRMGVWDINVFEVRIEKNKVFIKQ